jgi:hypothetical protein
MSEFQSAATIEDLSSLDETEMLEGYQAGYKGEAEPGSDRSRSYYHGWRNGMVDSKRLVATPEQLHLARVVVETGYLKTKGFDYTLLHIRVGLQQDQESNATYIQVKVSPMKAKKAADHYEKTTGVRVKFDALLKPVLIGNYLPSEYMLQCLEEDMEEGCKLVVEAFKAQSAIELEQAAKLNAAIQGAQTQIVKAGHLKAQH